MCLNHALCRYVAVMDNARLFLTDAEANELIEVPYIHMCVYINICLCIYIYRFGILAIHHLTSKCNHDLESCKTSKFDHLKPYDNLTT